MEWVSIGTEKPKQTFQCDNCGSQYKSASSLKRHKALSTCTRPEIKTEVDEETVDKIVNKTVERYRSSGNQQTSYTSGSLPEFDIDSIDIDKNPNLKGGFSGMLIASRRSGKSTIIKYLYPRFKKMFDIIFFFSNTLMNDTYSMVEEPKFSYYEPKIIKSLLSFMTKTKTMFRVLVIMDDCITNKTRECPFLRELFTAGRNYGGGISILISSQVSTMVNKKSRSNCDFIFLGKNNSIENRKNIIESFLLTCVRPPEKFNKDSKFKYVDEFMIANTKDHNFIVIDMFNDGENMYNFKVKEK